MKGFATLRSGGLQLKGSATGAVQGAIRSAVIPSIAVFPLLQHTGAPAESLVSPGDRVREGMVIARASGRISAPVHSSIPGVVTMQRNVRLPNGERSNAIFVKLEGEFDRFGTSAAIPSGGATLEAEDLLGRLLDNGLVTLDSDAVPLHVLWKLPKGKRVERLVVSALNDEPFLSVEHRLSVERPEAIARGLSIAAKILRPASIIYVAEPANLDEDQESGLAGMLRSVAAEEGVDFSQVTIGNRYPRGEQRELVRAVTEEKVPPGTSPLNVGIFVTNASTLVAVSDAVLGGKPLIERYVTVAGGALTEPATLRVRIGTPVRDLIEECGGFREIPERIVIGGSLTGSVVYDLDTPVMKNTTAVLALTRRESLPGERAPCISCGRCLIACPEGLNPTKLFNEIEHGRYGNAVAAGLLDCSECGSCSFVCPSRIPLLHGMRLGKRMLRSEEMAE